MKPATRLLLLVIAAGSLSACYIGGPGYHHDRQGQYIAGHFGQDGFWVPGHFSHQ